MLRVASVLTYVQKRPLVSTTLYASLASTCAGWGSSVSPVGSLFVYVCVDTRLLRRRPYA
jgi:hypothetical protein